MFADQLAHLLADALGGERGEDAVGAGGGDGQIVEEGSFNGRDTPLTGTAEALIAFLAQTGFDIKARYGDWERGPITEHSKEIVTVARWHCPRSAVCSRDARRRHPARS
jgi:hypothetical protein